MSHGKQGFLVMTVAQAVCLALGLWIQERFVASLGPSGVDGVGAIHSSRVEGTVAKGRPMQRKGDTPDAPASADPALTGRAITFLWIAGLQSLVAYLVLTRIQVRASQEQVRSAKESSRRQKDLMRTRDAVIFGLAKLAESRDPETGNHLERIALYSTRLAAALRKDPCYRNHVTRPFVKMIGISSVLHDIGKVGVQDAILLKPGKLEREERFVMQLHAAIGGRCIGRIESRLGSSNFLRMAREIAFCHHERWDGKGYPKGLVGEEIPLAARIVAIADVYDALSTKRVYKEPLPHEQCVQIIRKEAGKQFDPKLVDVFLDLEAEFQTIGRRFAPATEGGEKPTDCGASGNTFLPQSLGAMKC